MIRTTPTGHALDTPTWFKSSYSGQTGGNCVEATHVGATHTALRDSKLAASPILVFPAKSTGAFLRTLRGQSTLA
jgi:uncharacterized protein DUF397